uniref:Small ribosomal subunit protein eS19 n=1 Tax=Phaeomonas parva TaxID=124430 RepID=A0A7S1U7F8_9STRA|mmetsp:Transcript_35230/g.110917  ORF Transcript_35230/g.110917 Transcript_35230/m.110917 type:complete len:150 (+) Transcript_35230:126-575(+)|eukprot:CAMPEP_0118853026 /NCGR_PEP_ID=MMETSP1163-20130328/1772_1 /TAXON_ID=124430 /ORGANISM="Phaeomonas parva, Strain CCMP2877" /LENGTH=149 /DNA_ID=CAMNT_0006785507 /DNA_START=308 /DNA_END=757 /DNA_ORIENTATION=+
MAEPRAITVKDVKAEDFIAAYAKYLKESNKLELPKWVAVVKTGPHKELAPNDPDWYFIRCASIARRVYLRPGCGIGNLRDWYGGSKSRGVRPQHHSKASAGIIRACLKQLEEMRIVEKCGKSGRRVSQVVGRREMDTIAGQVARGEDEA